MGNANLLHFLATVLAGWVNRHQQAFIDYLMEETRGLVTYYVLFVIHLATRKISIAGVTPSPNGAFMMQIARSLTDEFDGFLRNHSYLIMDRDTKLTEAFRDALEREGVEPVRCPPRAPTCNAYAERFVRSIKSECFDRMILLGERSLRRALREYSPHYLRERNHQGMDNQLLEPTNFAMDRCNPRHATVAGALTARIHLFLAPDGC